MMWDRACVDAASLPAPAGGEHTGRNPTDRGKLGCKHHVLLDERGLAPVAQISGAQVHDARFLIRLVASIPAAKGWQAVPANVQVSCMPILPTLREPIGLGCAIRALQLVSHATAWSHAQGSDGGVGALSEPRGGYTASADCAFGTSGEQTRTKRSCRLPARSSVGGMSPKSRPLLHDSV